jgi:GNAT superfamily N-acetyltransferase
MMITISNYTESDAEEVGRLIADTYSEFNLSFASPQERALFLGPFHHAGSSEEAHKKEITQTLQSPIFYVAEIKGEIVGILRGRKERLASLFVRKDFQFQGIGRKLVEQFEAESVAQDVSVIRVAATLYAVPFYIKMGYWRSTGVRSGRSFDGDGFLYQPMKKILKTQEESSKDI